MASPQLAPDRRPQPRFRRFLQGIWRSIYRRPPRYEKPYSENLIAIYHGELLKQDDAAIRARVEELGQLEKTPEIACELELLNLRLVDPGAMAQLVAQLRKRWSFLSGDDAGDQQKPENQDHAGLMSEAALLTAQIHRQYSLQRLFDDQKRWVLFWMLFWFVAATVVLGYLMAKGDLRTQGVLLKELLAGIMGGYTSSLMRVYQMEAGKDLVEGIQRVRSGIISLIAKPALGGIFAILLHLLFMGKALTGGMFPALSISGAGDKLVHFSDFFAGAVEATSVDFAKLLLWCFIAGFAERMVPDLLDSMADKASKTAAK